MAADTDKKDGPQIGGHRPAAQQEPAGQQQAWVPAKPTALQEPEAPAVEGQVPGSTTTVTHQHTTIINGDQKKEMTAKEKLEAGVNGIISGAGGLKEGQMIGEAVGAGIKNLFGQGGKGGPSAPQVTTQVGPGFLGPNASGQMPEGHEQEGPEAGGLDVGGSLGKKIGGMVGSLGGNTGKTVGQMLGKAAGNLAGQAADVAVDHARGIGGKIGGAIGGAINGEQGAAVGKSIGKEMGSGVKSVRDTLASQGVQLGAKQTQGKHGHGLK